MTWARDLTEAAERRRGMHRVPVITVCRRQTRAHLRLLGPTVGCRRAAPDTCNALFVDVVAACVWRGVLEGCRRDALPPGVLAWRPCMTCCRAVCVGILISLTRARARGARRFCAFVRWALNFVVYNHILLFCTQTQIFQMLAVLHPVNEIAATESGFAV